MCMIFVMQEKYSGVAVFVFLIVRALVLSELFWFVCQSDIVQVWVPALLTLGV